MNSSKNKLNGKIIYNFHPNPNAHADAVYRKIQEKYFKFNTFFFQENLIHYTFNYYIK